MNRMTGRILAICATGLLVWLSVAIAAPTEKKSETTRTGNNLGQTRTAIEMGAPETDAGLSPSAPPNLDRATAPSWEGGAPSALRTEGETGQDPAALSAYALYQINWQSINIGGETSTSPGYSALQSIGQESIGSTNSTSYTLRQGYWYGAPLSANTPSCVCNCHADPLCDGIINNVQDVVTSIGVAFRGGAAVTDPNPLCPREPTDVNCDGFTNVVDVVKVVGVAFRGANPATEYCDPCPGP